MVQTVLGMGSAPIDFAALREFPGLKGSTFQHLFDLQATVNLQKVPLLSGAITKLNSSVSERQMGLMLSSRCIRLGRNQGRSIYEKFERAAAILDLPNLPEVYLSSGMEFNAVAYGIETYRIILYAPLVDALTEEELLAVIGHELGHMKCRHELYMTMVYYLRSFGEGFIRSVLPFGIGATVTLGLQLAVLHWYRMAELSCDRAALLVVQDPLIVARMLSKLAGGSRRILNEINLEGILQQVARYDDTDDKFDKLIKLNLMLSETHPFPLVRVKEVMAWAESDQYQQLMDGTVAEGGPVGTRPQPGVVCAKCKAVVSITAVYCPGCSIRQRGTVRVCAACGVQVESSATTCAACENELVTAIT